MTTIYLVQGNCGEKMPLREFLGDGFFDDIEKMKTLGAERVVFWFDN